MRFRVEGVPDHVYVDGTRYDIMQKSGSTGSTLRVQMTKPRGRYTTPDYVEGNNVADLSRKITTWVTATQRDKEERKARKDALTNPVTVHAVFQGRRVLVRGYHGTSGKLLITYEDDGEKDAVDESRLSPTSVDVSRLQGLYQEVEATKQAMDRLAVSFYRSTKDLDDAEILVTYRPETDDYLGQYEEFSATASAVREVTRDVERRIQEHRLPWTLTEDEIGIRRSADVVERDWLSGVGFRTNDDAVRYLELQEQEGRLTDEAIKAHGKFDYEAELAKAKVKS